LIKNWKNSDLHQTYIIWCRNRCKQEKIA